MVKWRQLIYMCMAVFVSLTIGCEDDLGLREGQMAEGDALLSLTVAFNQEKTSIGTRMEGGDKGNDMDNINTLYMVVYKSTGELYGRYPIYGEGLTPHKDVSNVEYKLTDNRNEDEQNLQNDATGKVTFDLKLISGSYYIYAVANVEGFDKKDISTREKLKALEFQWDETDTKKNSQMFGTFTFEPNRNAMDGEPLAVSATTDKLHCWVRRLASKVTVAFDGSDLYDNVQIYITDIAVKDIPKKCTLGNPNTPGPDVEGGDEVADRKNRFKMNNGVIENGKAIKVQELPDDRSQILPDKYLHVCNDQHPYLGVGEDGGSKEMAHGQGALSLFFYENMQGTGKSKKQSQNGNTIDFPDPDIEKPESGWKDEKPYGTYVEVKGYYRCLTASSHLGFGPITFRYMLGQKSEEDNDYNARRNTHYKLTLKFKGYGNDADWHIDYEEYAGIYTSTPQYISYLYNKKVMATVKIVGKMKPGTRLYAEVVGVGNETSDYNQARKEGETFWRPWGDGTESYPDPDLAHDPEKPSKDYYWKGSVNLDGPWNSFLSLKLTNRLIIVDPADPEDKNGANTNYNMTYYMNGGRGQRDYKMEEGPDGSDAIGGEGLYRVEHTKKIEDDVVERVYYIPLYTRAKTLLSRTGYVGNNPYVAYPRKARIKFWAYIYDPEIEAEDEDGKYSKKEIYLDIIQVHRIVNPKGVWRKSGTQHKQFHVRLLRQPGENTDFIAFDSQGGWCADVLSTGDNIITLTSTEEGSGGNSPQHGVMHVEGISEHPVDFMINFNGNEGAAIVRVRYHNYTCEHDIFCSVGDGPVKLTETKTEDGKEVWWHRRNVYRFNANGAPVYTSSPVEEGSLFRRGNNTAILAKNNETYRLGIDPATVGDHKFAVVPAGDTEVEERKSWDELLPSSTDDGSLFVDWSIPGNSEGERIATVEDYYTLIPEDKNDLTFPIKQAYGVLYGDAAESVQYSQSDAYGNMHEDGEETSKGMQGCFVYNVKTCQHIFLPIGASGYGHRKHSGGWRNYDKPGTLRYGSRSDPFDEYDAASLIYQPLFYDLYRRQGAIYWGKKRNQHGTEVSGKRSCAFDINYFTMSFTGYGNDAAAADNGADSHACFIRTVYER